MLAKNEIDDQQKNLLDCFSISNLWYISYAILYAKSDRGVSRSSSNPARSEDEKNDTCNKTMAVSAFAYNITISY